jgi:twitching motility protein PilT
MSISVKEALQFLVDHEGSDLHVKVGSPPMARLDGDLMPVPGAEPLTPADTQRALAEILDSPNRAEELIKEGEVDFAFAVPGLARFRVNAFKQRGSISIVCRRIPFGVYTIEQLGLPDVVRETAEEPRGIVLVTGTTGSGKSTTLAAMVDHINEIAPRHIVTIEDPIEFLHSDKRSVVNQREIGSDTGSFARALRRVLRQDPDVILIGEMRDEETVRTALSAAETGHLVFSTLHTADAAETINRIIDFFPPYQHKQIRSMLASTLKGVISQRLIPAAGGGRVAALEVLRSTGRVRDAILDMNQAGELTEIIAEGSFYGMQTFDQALFEHVSSGRITQEAAMAAASSPQDFKLMLAAEGRRSSMLPDEPAPVGQGVALNLEPAPSVGPGAPLNLG